MNVQVLESRSVPSVFAVEGGSLYELDSHSGTVVAAYGRVIEPTADDVPFSVAADGDTVVLAAGAGGGPRVVGYDLTKHETAWSVFVGDPAARSGVGLSAREPAAPTIPDTLAAPPDYTVGPGAKTLYIAGATVDVVDRVHSVLSQIVPVVVTNVRPDADPMTYYSVYLNSPTGWFRRETGVAAAGYTQGRTGYVAVLNDPVFVPEAVLHEFGHALGLQHNPTDTSDIMYPGLNTPFGHYSQQEQEQIRGQLQ